MGPNTRFRLKQLLSLIGLRAAIGEPYRFAVTQYLSSLKRQGFSPSVCVDVGAADGTFEIYKSFPKSFHVLVVPVPAFSHRLEAVLHRYRGALLNNAAGAYDGKAFLRLRDDLHASSIGQTQTDTEVTVRRVDTMIEELGLNGPFLIKADTQGTELDVIRGATKVLAHTEVVILETSLFRFEPDMPLHHEVIAFMNDLGFVPHGVFGGYGRPFDGALAQVDVAFVKEDGIFRKSDIFITPEQALAYQRRLLSRMKRMLDSR
jgi:FkbM family methyltransferase